MPDQNVIAVPGSFVVLQGMPGDGMSNTINTMPHYVPPGTINAEMEQDDSGVMSFDGNSEDDIPDNQNTNTNTDMETNNANQAPTPMQIPIGYNMFHHSMLTRGVGPGVVPGAVLAANETGNVTTGNSARTNDGAQSGDDGFIMVPTGTTPGTTQLAPTTRISTIESPSRLNTKLHPDQRRSVQLWEEESRRREIELWEDLHGTTNGCHWWQRNGRLVILGSLPATASRLVENNLEVVGVLSPGVTVVAMELVTIPEQDDMDLDEPNERRRRTGDWHFLKIDSPQQGYVLLRHENGYSFLAPGLPSSFGDPGSWTWRVTCKEGAFVREGLELSSSHTDTIPHGSFLRVEQKTVNSIGLSRLRIKAITANNFSNKNAAESAMLVTGWVSESLNPLSGQRGPIVQPVPLPIPCQYRVILQDGAVIRSGVELSSPQIGRAPNNQVLTVVGRAFTDHPMDQCIERLKLAGGAGWISARLNRPIPMNEPVVEFVGVDGSFDPEDPGAWHLDAQYKARQNSDLASSVSSYGGVAELSSIDDRQSSSSSSSSSTPPDSRQPYRMSDDRCVICLIEERNSTIVHGETGHIACCLACSRILKARGDRCPVCRMPIDSVIQQFWA
eukprot:CAMPEP_0118684388 /NCGR_PEP_ID=MMETSP0800-20121206/6615_1 /TAXON_ID=210618 ORGANISM="Striatella unipunctata, Strain CCMP2910" /NCGR_SAMPLE_ID=MMETSP0800 /ASSEMBLY_ACC=CAM_ASM_000638 /LENGTH=614 /DNA_ID=CAMNT_0006581087 /DNA_START=124 /DNA_END=1968 /DNA_ORIENTATION=+